MTAHKKGTFKIVVFWILGLGVSILAPFLAIVGFLCWVEHRAEGIKPIQNISLLTPMAVQFDPVTGYRWLPGKHQICRIVDYRVSFVQSFEPNENGFISNHNFEKKKGDVFRILVFGDSFTAAEFLQTPWPQCLESVLNSKKGGNTPKIEIYSFAIDGGGIENWHSTYFNLVQNDYDFDGVIIGLYHDNLSRQFSIFHATGEGTFFTRVTPRPLDDEMFYADVFPRMHLAYALATTEQINRIVETSGNWSVRLLPSIKALKNGWLNGRSSLLPEKKRVSPDCSVSQDHLPEPRTEHEFNSLSAEQTLDRMRRKYGVWHLAQLQAITDDCKANGKSVIIASIPDREIVEAGMEDSVANELRAEFRCLATEFGVVFFDGYLPFFSRFRISNSKLWLTGDGHWSQAGSDLFSQHLADYLLKTWSFEVPKQ